MMRQTPWVLAALCFMGCGKPHCPAGDSACVFASMTIADFNGKGGDFIGGPPFSLVSVDPARLAALASPDGGASVTNLSGPLTYSSGDEGGLLGLDWNDPSGCVPAFCMSACPRHVRCFAARCTPSINDGRQLGRSLEWVKFEKPTEAPLDIDLDVFAVSAPGCPTDISAALAAGTARVSRPTPVQVTVGLPDTGSSGSSGGTTTGTSGGSCASGGLEASTILCVPTNATTCDCQGAADRCISAQEYQQAVGRPLPASCNPAGGTNCFSSINGQVTITAPCCPGLRCITLARCGGPQGTCVQ
jgi:hypothetical protein